LEKEKEERYQHIDELLADLRHEKKSLEYVKTTRIPPEAAPTKPKKTLLPFIVPASIVFVIVLLFLILKPFQVQIVPEKEAVSLPTGEPSVAIMYFENNTGDESLDHWRKAIADLLITDLAQSKYISVLSGDRLFNILSQLDQVEARRVGNYAKAGENFRINVMLQEASTGELLGSEKVEGIGEKSIFSMVDELTKRIKANFKLSAEEIAGDLDRAVGKITTSSPEAYKYYSEGRKYHSQRDYRKSIQLMERAVAIDPEFAMAYRSMAVSYGNQGYSSDNRRYAQKAFELADHVSERERYKIQGEFYSQSEKTYDKSIEAYLKLLQLYPDDVTGNNNLGLKYYQLEQWDKARERFEVCVQYKSETTYPYTNLAYVHAAQGLYDKAREVLHYYLNNISENVSLRGRVGTYYLCQGQYGLALAEVDKALSIDPTNYGNLLRKGDIYHCKGDLTNAENEYQKLLEQEEPMAHLGSRERLAALYLLQGKFEKSKEEVEKGIELAEKLGEKGWESEFLLRLAYTYRKSGNPKKALEECNNAWNGYVEAQDLGGQRIALYNKGCSYIEMNAIDKAQRTADELKELIEKGMNKKIIRLYHHLMGMIELERNNFSKAIEYSEKALSSLPFQSSSSDPHALFIAPLALAYYKAGDLEKARQEYEKITSLTTGRLSYGDIYAKSFYMLGRIYQEKGWEGKAIEHYEQFLELWKDADPGIPEVEDARERLEKLRVES
jgi:tetratricopeptide (TPR) repeat protein